MTSPKMNSELRRFDDVKLGDELPTLAVPITVQPAACSPFTTVSKRLGAIAR